MNKRTTYVIGFFVFVLLMIFATCQLHAQPRVYGLYGTEAAATTLDTITNSSTSTTSRTVTFSNYTQGSVSIFGQVKLLTGTSVTKTVTCYLLMDADNSLYSPAQTVGTITTTTDSLAFYFPISAQTWWGDCAGYKIVISGAAGTYSEEVKLKGRHR